MPCHGCWADDSGAPLWNSGGARLISVCGLCMFCVCERERETEIDKVRESIRVAHSSSAHMVWGVLMVTVCVCVCV